jgi:AraC family transcriptional regulator
LEIPPGTYAVFHYKGLSSDSSVWRYIYNEWLPNSPWELDHRPHFERLGAKYKNEDPNSEEDIYIPVRPRA